MNDDGSQSTRALWGMLAVAVCLLGAQLFPSAVATALSTVDVRNWTWLDASQWTWRAYVALSTVAIVALVGVKAWQNR